MTVADVYASRRDVFTYGLPRGALAGPARLADSVTASTDLIELDQHGFEDDDPITLRVAEGGTMPGGLTAGTTYYVLRETDSTFKLAATAGGSAINITSSGESVFVTADLPFDEVLEFYSRWVDGVIPHAVPLESPYPILVVGVVATLAAKRLQIISGVSSDTMTEAELQAKAQLERWAKGLPVRDERVTAGTNLAVSAVVSTTDPRGWGTGTIP